MQETLDTGIRKTVYGSNKLAGKQAVQSGAPTATTHDPRPTTHEQRPTTHEQRPTNNDPHPDPIAMILLDIGYDMTYLAY